jgi:hypothetical protein
MRSPQRNGQERSYAWIRSNILGLVAIFIALSGSAVAAQVASDNGGATKAAKKKKKGGKPGPAGPQGPAGPAGSAVAFAHVNADGTLDGANSKNISAAVESGQDGYYCVTPSVAVRNMIASTDTANTRSTASAGFGDPFTACPNGAAVVSTFNNAGTYTSTPFYISFN